MSSSDGDRVPSDYRTFGATWQTFNEGECVYVCGNIMADRVYNSYLCVAGMRSQCEVSDVDPAHRELGIPMYRFVLSRPANGEIYRWHIYNAARTLLAVSTAATRHQYLCILHYCCTQRQDRAHRHRCLLNFSSTFIKALTFTIYIRSILRSKFFKLLIFVLLLHRDLSIIFNFTITVKTLHIVKNSFADCDDIYE